MSPRYRSRPDIGASEDWHPAPLWAAIVVVALPVLVIFLSGVLVGLVWLR